MEGASDVGTPASVDPEPQQVVEATSNPTAETKTASDGLDKDATEEAAAEGADDASGTVGDNQRADDAGNAPSPAGETELADEREDDNELDLVAIRKFEYEQVAKFGPSQLKRYEQYRRSDLKKEKVKKVLTALNPALARASDQYIIAIKGLAKVFVGDVVEAALQVKLQFGDKGALQPKHIREAYRRLRRDGAIPGTDVRPSAVG